MKNQKLNKKTKNIKETELNLIEKISKALEGMSHINEGLYTVTK